MKKIISIVIVMTVFSLSGRADEAKAAEPSSGKTPVSTGKYITGGVLGTTIGFGIGHAVQGRYREKGWIFTAGESAGTLLMISGASSCVSSAYSFSSSCNSSTMTFGLGVMLGFHIWEIVDVWVGATPVEDKVQTYIVPKNDGTQIGMLWNF